MKNKRIVFVHFFNSYTGSPQVLKTVIESLTDYEVTLITNRTEGFLTGLDINYHYFNFNLTNNRLTTLFNYFAAQVSIFFKVLFIINKNDLAYINTSIPVFAAFAARVKGATILFHLHEDRKSLNFVHRFVSYFRKYFCEYEIFVSNYLFTKEHIPGKKYFILPNVLNKNFFEKAVKHSLIDKTKLPFNVLMICSLKTYKGVYEFLDIADKLLTEKDITFTLVVSETKELIDNFFYNTFIPSNVTIHESTYNTIPFYEKASIVLSLSRVDEWIETFGLTILEGMSFGIPCIVPPIGGPTELIKPEVNGFQISSYDKVRIINSILMLRNDKELYKKISNNNKKRALDFSYVAFKEKLNKTINEI